MKLKTAGQWLLMMLVGLPLYAEGIESITGQGIIQRVGTIVKNVGAVVGSIGLMVALISASIAYFGGDERAMKYIKGGIAGSFLAFGAYAIGIWLTSSFR